MATRITVAGLRRQVLARGCTLKPRCPACQQEVDAKRFTKAGICQPCDVAIQAAERAHAEARLAEIDARLRVLWQAAREATDADQAEAIACEEAALEGERWEHLVLVDPGAFSRAGGDDA